MYTFHFVNFVGNLDIQAPEHEGIPANSNIYIFYKEKEELSKHEVLRRFHRLLSNNHVTFLRPLQDLTSEWMIDLKELKQRFSCFENTTYLKGKITIEPDYWVEEKDPDVWGEGKYETYLKFSIYYEDVKHLFFSRGSQLPEELNAPLKKFKKDFPAPQQSSFLMTKFEDTPLQLKVIEIIRAELERHNITLLRADDKWYADEVFNNIRTYMHGCDFGIAIFDRVKTEYFNPNVSLEIGYMMALEKDVLLLKDSTLHSLPTDLVGKLYHEYNFQLPEETIPIVIKKWLKDKDLI